MTNPANNSQQMILDAFQNETYIGDRVDVQNTPVYDTVTFAAAASITTAASQFFTNVGGASGKTIAQTNFTRNGEMPAPEAFAVFAFRYKWVETVHATDLLAIIAGFAFEFFLGTKYYQRAPLWYYSAGGGIYSVTNSSAATWYSNGEPTRESMHKLAIPVVIEANMALYGQLNGNTLALIASASGGTGYSNQLLLDGLYARGVQ